jgi:hypothetical protein
VSTGCLPGLCPYDFCGPRIPQLTIYDDNREGDTMASLWAPDSWNWIFQNCLPSVHGNHIIGDWTAIDQCKHQHHGVRSSDAWRAADHSGRRLEHGPDGLAMGFAREVAGHSTHLLRPKRTRWIGNIDPNSTWGKPKRLFPRSMVFNQNVHGTHGRM